jgi:hypothetical protein
VFGRLFALLRVTRRELFVPKMLLTIRLFAVLAPLRENLRVKYVVDHYSFWDKWGFLY